MAKREVISKSGTGTHRINTRDPIAVASSIAARISLLDDGTPFQERIQDVARSVGLSTKEVVDLFRLNNLPEYIQILVPDGVLTVEGASRIEPLLRDKMLNIPDAHVVEQMIFKRRKRFAEMALPSSEITSLIAEIRLKFLVASPPIFPKPPKPPETPPTPVGKLAELEKRFMLKKVRSILEGLRKDQFSNHEFKDWALFIVAHVLEINHSPSFGYLMRSFHQDEIMLRVLLETLKRELAVHGIEFVKIERHGGNPAAYDIRELKKAEDDGEVEDKAEEIEESASEEIFEIEEEPPEVDLRKIEEGIIGD